MNNHFILDTIGIGKPTIRQVNVISTETYLDGRSLARITYEDGTGNRQIPSSEVFTTIEEARTHIPVSLFTQKDLNENTIEET